MRRIGLFSLLLALCLVLSGAPRAAAWQIQLKQWGGGSFYTTDFSLRNANLQSTGVLAFMAGPIWERPEARLEWRLEGQAGKFWNYSSGVELALLPSLRLYLLSGQPRGPSFYTEVGVGPSYNSLHIKELGLAFNFLSFAGAGIRLPLLEHTHLELGYRMRHISNAGLDDDNGGVSSHQMLIELAIDY